MCFCVAYAYIPLCVMMGWQSDTYVIMLAFLLHASLPRKTSGSKENLLVF